MKSKKELNLQTGESFGRRVQGSLMETLVVFQAWILFCFPLETSCLYGSSPGGTCSPSQGAAAGDAGVGTPDALRIAKKSLSEALLSQITPCLRRLIHQ